MLFALGGSLNNMYAMVLARHKLKPDTKSKGLYCMGPLVAYTSEDVSIFLKISPRRGCKIFILIK